MHKSLYAIVLNYNNYIDTKQCIESLEQSLYPIEKIILIDNGSKNGSIERLQNDYLQNNKVYIIRNEDNLGFARGVNVGIQFALDLGAELFFLLNNDAIIDKECIKNLCAAIAEDERIGIAGPRIFYYNDPEKIWQGGGYFSFIKAGIINPEKNKLISHCSGKIREVTFLTGCAMLVRREVFERIGLFDEDFFFYGEDVDFCLRARRAGFKLMYVPAAKVWHKIENIAKNRTLPFHLYHLARSHLFVIRKNFGTLYSCYALIVHLLLYTPYRMWQIAHGSRSWKAVIAWFKGTLDGLKRLEKY